MIVQGSTFGVKVNFGYQGQNEVYQVKIFGFGGKYFGLEVKI